MSDIYSRRRFWFHKFEFIYYRIVQHFYSIKNPTEFFMRKYCGGESCTNKYFANAFEFIPTNDIGKKLFFNGQFEMDEINVCRTLIKESDIVLDIGGNIGFHAIHFSQFAHKGQVYSFEPSPDTFKLLLKNCERYQNIQPINIGLAKTEGLARFHYASDHAYSGFKDTGKKSIIGYEDLPVASLDKWVKEKALKRIDFIKIDVEGFEEQVIEGMTQVIKHYKPILFVEISPTKNQTENPEIIFNSILSFGYSAFCIIENNLVQSEKHLDTHHNYFFLKKNN